MRARRSAARTYAVGLAALAGSLLGAAQAQAGTYVIRSCNVPGHATAPITPWKASLVPNVTLFDNCAAGGGFGLTFPGLRSMGIRTEASLSLAEPDAMELRRIRLWFVARLTNTANGSELHATVALPTSDNSGVFEEVWAPGISKLDRPFDQELADTVRGIKLGLRCIEVPLEPPYMNCLPSDVNPIEVQGAELTIEENGEPAATVTGGTLFTEGAVSAIRTLTYSSTDHQSGIKTIEVVIGDTVVAVKNLTCIYSDFTPCPSADADSLAIDTRKVPDGIHPAILRTTDAAGNQTSMQVQLINVQNPGTPADVVAAEQTETARLTARFAQTKRPTMIVPFGRRVTVRGRLFDDESKSGLGNTKIEVLQRSGTRERSVGSTRTHANGSFTYRRSIRGPTRTLRFVYRPQAGGRVAAASPTLKLRVRAESGLRVSLRGRLVRFSGQIRTRPLPGRGKQVRLQGRTTGFAWATFAIKRADRRGRFSGRYRLPVRRPGVRLEIRVWVPSERGYRYLSYRGKARKLRVR